MLFWLACEDLKEEINKGAIEEKAHSIYEDYISILSPKEVRGLHASMSHQTVCRTILLLQTASFREKLLSVDLIGFHDGAHGCSALWNLWVRSSKTLISRMNSEKERGPGTVLDCVEV